MCRRHTETTSCIATMQEKPIQQNPPAPLQVVLTIDSSIIPNSDSINGGNIDHEIHINSIIFTVISRFHAGYFRISLSLCWQTLLWKTLVEPPENAHAYRKMLGMMPYASFLLMWSLSLFVLVAFSVVYVLRCMLLSEMVKKEYLNQIRVNYLFAPWISWLLLLQSSPFLERKNVYYHVLWWVFVLPIFVLDVKIYGQWFTKGKRFLSTVANPASQLSVVGNFVGAGAAAQMGWRECGMIMFSLGFVHYVVLFVTLYQRLSGNSCMPTSLRPVMFLFIAAPSMASLAWDSISGTFDCSSKMLFYLSLFLFLSLVSRPNLFKKSMKKFSVVWWSYSYPLTVLALASTEYAEEMKSSVAHLLMLVICGLSVLVSFVIMVYTTLNTNLFLPASSQS
ncbi:hypothetical protein R6Q59_021562 [Mikania micrantha]